MTLKPKQVCLCPWILDRLSMDINFFCLYFYAIFLIWVLEINHFHLQFIFTGSHCFLSVIRKCPMLFIPGAQKLLMRWSLTSFTKIHQLSLNAFNICVDDHIWTKTGKKESNLFLTVGLIIFFSFEHLCNHCGKGKQSIIWSSDCNLI